MKPTHLYLSLATLLGGACGFAHPGAARVRLGGGHSGANRLARPQAVAAPADNGVDVMQAAKYPVATACQFGLIAALFRATAEAQELYDGSGSYFRYVDFCDYRSYSLSIVCRKISAVPSSSFKK